MGIITSKQDASQVLRLSFDDATQSIRTQSTGSTNGSPAPSGSQVVAGVDPSGNTYPLQTNSSGALEVTFAASGTQTVVQPNGALLHTTVDASALPTGAATSSLQTSGNASLSSVDTKLTSQATAANQSTANASLNSIDTKTPALALGRVPVDGSGVTQPVSAASLPLPTGAATSANQTTAQASLSSIDSKLTSPLVVTTGGLTDTQLRATPVPVSGTVAVTGPLTDTQLRATAVPVSVSGVSTAANQATANGSLASIDTKLTSPLTITGALTDTQLRATPVPVSGTVTATVTGVATETTLAALNAKIPVQGQAVMAASQPVVIASDQSAISVNSSVVDITTSGTITTQNLNATSGTATVNSTVTLTLSGQSSLMLQTLGTWTGNLTVQGTVNGTNWITVGGLQLISTGVLQMAIAGGTQSIWQAEVAGLAQVRVTALVAVTGSVNISMKASRSTGMVGINSPIPPGANIIGSLVGNQTVNNAQIAGVATATGNGITGTGSQRVTIASDNTAFNVLSTTAGKAATNLPIYTNYVSTPVTTATYVQLVASTTAAVTRISIFDSSGQAMILATGAAASEVIRLYIPPGGGDFDLAIPISTRITIKALISDATSGYNLLNMLS